MPIRQVVPQKKIESGGVTSLRLVTVTAGFEKAIPETLAQPAAAEDHTPTVETVSSSGHRSLFVKRTRNAHWRIVIALAILVAVAYWWKS
jgi:hypothetical protein